MSTLQEPSARSLTTQEAVVLLQQILCAVEKEKRQRWVEIACAVVLALATTASAWCAYQATLWGGVQGFRMAEAGKAGRESSENTITSLQFRAFDASMLLKFIEAKSAGNTKLADFLYHRFRPEVKKALDAWLKTDPFNNPNSPPSPLAMPEYVQKEAEEAKRQEALAEQAFAGAREANETGDRYVLLTVIFTSVLFFGGIGGIFDSRWLRVVLGIIALALFLGTMIALTAMPICRE
ncbi:MAG: hypothetical protein ACJ8FY_02035 [Gemmataceae bacterium]